MKKRTEFLRRFRAYRERLSQTLAALLCLVAWGVQGANLAYWQFESGDPGADTSGNNHILNLTGVTTTADVAANAPGGSSAVFNGSAFAQTAATLDLSSVRTLTLEFFAKSTQTDLGMICEHGPDILGVSGAFYCDFNEGGANFRLTHFSTGFNYASGAAPVRDGNWHHYAATVDNRGEMVVFNLYVDGNHLATVTQAQGVSAPGINDLFNIGARNGSLFFYSGGLDEMRLSDRILDPAAFLRNHYANVTFGITQQPTNTTVMEGSPATFTVGVAVTNAPVGVIEYQWLKNGVEIPGATDASYTIPLTSYSTDNAAEFSVRVTAAGIFVATIVTSETAQLTVVKDTTPPVLLGTFAPAANFVTLVFDSALDPATAVNPALYSLDGGATVDSASLIQNHLIVLGVSGLAAPAYTVSFSEVSDLFGNLASGSLSGTNQTGLAYADIGTVSVPGYVYATNTTQTIVAATGSDVWGGVDGLGYLYTNLTGDFDLRVRVENIGGAFNPNTRGGLMIREDTYFGSRNIAALTYVNADNWVVTARTETDGVTTIPGYPGAGLIARTSPYPNAWLRMTRADNTFRTYYSSNNLDWVALDGGGITPATPFADTLLVGMASSQISVAGPISGPQATFTYSGFYNFVVTEGTIVITTQPTNTVVLENRPVSFYVAATLQGGDSSALRYQWLTNGVSVVGAAAPTLTLATPPRSLSGVQVRCVVSAGPNLAPLASDPVTLTVTPDTAGPIAVTASASALDPYTAFVVFDELLDEFTATDPSRYTLDGDHYVYGAALQADRRTVILSVDGLVSPQFNVTCTGITDLAGNPTTQTVTGTIYNLGWTMTDIQGAFPTTSSVIGTTPDGFTLQSQFGDIWGAVDSCVFVYHPMTNDFDIAGQIVNISGGATWSRGGLMARVSTDGDSPNLMVGSYSQAQGSYVWTGRSTPGGATAYGLAVQNPSFPDVWARMQRVGNTFIAYHSADGYHWTQFGEITDMQADSVMLVGIGFSTCMLTDPTLGTIQFEHLGPTVLLPQLLITQSGANVVLSWPTSAVGFQLQQTSQLGTEVNWSVVANPPTQVADTWQVTLPISGNSFYRLVR
ncbi:MAG: hypothetical protein M9920_11090 [Verrucomicrobiae bacterium]|nr:hypothetical protein [Verrucomicrobiae bacterium]